MSGVGILCRSIPVLNLPLPKQDGSFISSPLHLSIALFPYGPSIRQLTLRFRFNPKSLVLMIKPLQQVRGDLQRKLDADSCPGRE
jgi:hypothetical protein